MKNLAKKAARKLVLPDAVAPAPFDMDGDGISDLAEMDFWNDLVNEDFVPPNMEDLYSFGCESKVLQLLKLPDGTVKVLVEGIDRVKILGCDNDKEYLAITTEIVKDKSDPKEDMLALSIAIVRKLEKLTNLNKKVPFEYMKTLKELKDPSKIADHIAAQINISIF